MTARHARVFVTMLFPLPLTCRAVVVLVLFYGCGLSARALALAPAPGRAAVSAGVANASAAVFQKNGDRFLREGDLRAAAREYARAAEAAPGDPLFRLTTGVALAALGEVEAAASQFRRAQSLAEDDVIAALLLQGALEERGQSAQALVVYLDTVRRFKQAGRTGFDASPSITRLQKGVARFPQSAVMFLLLGDACQVAEQWDEAARAYERALLLAPRWAKPCVNLGVLRLAQGRPDAAVKAFETALAREPGNPQVQLLSGDAQAKAGRPADALQTYRRLENTPGVAADANTRIGNLYLQNRQPKQALESFTRARVLAPRDPKAIAGYAEAQVQSGNFQEGAEAYSSALRLANAGGLLSTRPILYRGLAEAQLSAQQPDAALATLERALGDEPQSAPLWYRLCAEAHFAKGDAAQAEAALRRALDSDRGRYPRETLNALAARSLLERIRAAYEAELSGPDRSQALVALAHLARYRGETEREIALREQVTTTRTLGMDWYLLADALERAGRVADARSAYLRALQLGGLSHAAEEHARTRIRALSLKPQPRSPQAR